MISTNYLHEYAPFDQFMYESYYLLLDMKDAENQLIALESTIQEKIFFGERVDGETLVLESEKQNIFARIGEAVISLFESFVDFLKKVGNTIKESVGNIRKKTSSDKIKEAMNKNPELADQFLQGVMSGKINAHTVKDLDALLDEATKISDDLATGKIDKRDHAKKIDDALERFGNRARNIGAIIGIVSSGLGVLNGLDNLTDFTGRKKAEIKYRNDRDAKNDAEREYQHNRNTEADKAAKEELTYRRNRDKESDGRADKNYNLAVSNNAISQANLDINKERHEWQKADRTNPPKDKVQKIKIVRNSASDLVDGEYLTESVNPINAIKKVIDFFSDYLGFCNDAVSKVNKTKEDLVRKVQSSQNADDASNVSAITSGFNKVLSAISKDVNTVKNASKSLEAKLA